MVKCPDKGNFRTDEFGMGPEFQRDGVHAGKEGIAGGRNRKLNDHMSPESGNRDGRQGLSYATPKPTPRTSCLQRGSTF